MKTKRSMIHRILCRISGLWLAAGCLALFLGFLLVKGYVSAEGIHHPQPVVPSALAVPGVPQTVSPADGATNQSINVDLQWMEGANGDHTTSYDVFFGTTSPPRLQGNTISTTFPLDYLKCGTHYYWKIIARNEAGSTSSPVWDFTTARPSHLPGLPARFRAVTPCLRWIIRSITTGR